jgi:hypothetical protein
MTSSRDFVTADPAAWLASLAPGSDQVEGATGVAGAVPPGLAAGMGGADPAWAFTGQAQAEAVQETIGQVCQGCELLERCPESACRFYRLEEAAQRYLDEGPEGEGWIIEGDF